MKLTEARDQLTLVQPFSSVEFNFHFRETNPTDPYDSIFLHPFYSDLSPTKQSVIKTKHQQTNIYIKLKIKNEKTCFFCRARFQILQHIFSNLVFLSCGLLVAAAWIFRDPNTSFQIQSNRRTPK